MYGAEINSSFNAKMAAYFLVSLAASDLSHFIVCWTSVSTTCAILVPPNLKILPYTSAVLFKIAESVFV